MVSVIEHDGWVFLFDVRAPTFRMPKDRTAPMILVGPGTGIAPYRSFWQQRQHDRGNALADGQSQDVGPGDVLLVFGCRHSKLDDLYKEEKVTAKEEGALTDVWTAYSREVQLPKVDL